MSKYNARDFAENTSAKLFGQEKPIQMSVSDPRYRYYQWLRSWFGMGERLVTNKCPFYQFMFFGSLLMVATFPLFIFAYIIYGVTKIIGIFAPSVPEQFENLKDENPFVFSTVISFLAGSISLLLSLLFLDNAIFWVGYVIHCIFAAPVVILWLVWEIISWICITFGLLFVWIWGLLVAINWGMLGYILGIGLLYLLCVVVTFWVLYRIAVFLFNRGFFNIFIKKSCKVRDERQAKKRARLAERRRLAALAKAEQDKYYKEHKEEIDAKNAKRQESAERWFKTIAKFLTPLRWVIQGIVYVLVGIGVSIWWFIKKIGEIIYVIWHMITSTVSNHCPAIEFLETFEDEGDFIPNRFGGGYIDGKNNRLHVDSEVLSEKFKIRTKQNDYKKIRINYNLAVGRGTDYDNRHCVHSINSIKYLPKPRKPRAKKVTTGGK